MTWGDLRPGDIVYKEPLGKHPVWLFARLVGSDVGVYMNLETGETSDVSHRTTDFLETDWAVLRDGVRVA